MLDWRLIDAMIYSSSSLECPALDNLFARNHIMIALSKADIESFAMQAVCVSNLYGAIDLYSEHYLRNLIVQLIHPRPVPKSVSKPSNTLFASQCTRLRTCFVCIQCPLDDESQPCIVDFGRILRSPQIRRRHRPPQSPKLSQSRSVPYHHSQHLRVSNHACRRTPA